jgi:outer membrane receptor protein involved in Fe transport
MKIQKMAPTKVAFAAALAVAAISSAHAQALNLDEVVVTGTATRASKMKQSVSVSTMSTEAIEMSAPSNAADVLRAVPGIRAEASGGDGNANINVRGLPSPDGGARYAQFQENGLPVMLFGDMMFGNADNFFRIDHNLERLEVIRGGSSSVATSNAPGAILNFIDKTGDEKGGTIGLTKGVNFDRTRLDMSYGGPLSDTTRFFIGGYMRQGEGPRSSGNNAENGHQIKGNVTHELGQGQYVRLNFKSLDDASPMYLPVPMTRSGNSVGSFPSFNALTGSTMPLGLRDVATNQFGQSVVTDTGSGAHIKSNSIGGEVNLNLDSGWKLNDKFRFSTNSGTWAGMTTPGAFGTAGSLATQYGGAGATAVFHNGGASATNEQAFVGHLFNVKINDLGNTVNDLKASKSFIADGAKVSTTVGLFSMTQAINMDWQWSSYLLSLNGANPQVFDIMKNGAKLNPTGTGFANGAAAWGNCCVTSYNLKYTQTAPNATVAWEKGAINADVGVRFDNIKASGTAQGGSPVNYGFTKPALTAGLNYAFDPNMSGFVRASQGTRFNADRVANSKSVNAITGAAVNVNGLFDAVEQMEAGVKYRSGNFSMFSTLFNAKTRITSYDPTQPTPELAANYKANGMELEAGYRNGGFRIAAGATYTNAQITDGDNAGKTPQRQAKWVYSLAPTYTVDKLTLGSSIVGTTAAPMDNGNTWNMPGYTVVNGFASYAIDNKTTASFSVNNLFNKLAITEVQQLNANSISARPITGRAVQVGLKYAF